VLYKRNTTFGLTTKFNNMQKDSINHEKPAIGNLLLADVVSLEEAKKLARLGWSKSQTKLGYKKRNNCSVYDKVVSNGKWSLDYDAPDKIEIKKMFYAVGKVGLSDVLNVSDLVNELVNYCKRQKLKLSDYYIH
jgi:hypothetical protein